MAKRSKTKVKPEDEGYLDRPNEAKVESFRKKMKKWRQELISALITAGEHRGASPAKRIAEAFYEDNTVMIAVLKYMMPQLKAVEMSIDEESPFRLVIDMTPKDDEDDEDEKDDNAEKEE